MTQRRPLVSSAVEYSLLVRCSVELIVSSVDFSLFMSVFHVVMSEVKFVCAEPFHCVCSVVSFVLRFVSDVSRSVTSVAVSVP